jgi:hypothetical protein
MGLPITKKYLHFMRIYSLAFFFLLIPLDIVAQDDLMDLLDKNASPEINYATATFKSTRIMNGHSIERMPPGQLDFRISHRFGKINSGAYEFFGFDQSSVHFSLEYGIFKWLMAGIGRGTYEKTFDGFTKFTILRQSSGAKVMPFSVSALSSVALTSVKWPDPARTNYFSSRLSFVQQVLIARKITFSGKILNLSTVDFTKNGKYDVTVEGDLNIHNVTNKVTAKGVIEIIAGGINATSKFNIVPEDYKITIPGIVRENIARNLEVTVKMNYLPLEKQ